MLLKHKIVILILCLGFSLTAQDLVPNGFFEIYSPCPSYGLSQPNNQQITFATGWYVSNGSPDYWNACSGGMHNTAGYQQDCCGGGAYAGMYAIGSLYTAGDDLGREYIGIRLLDTLKNGVKYLASMNIARADFNYSIKTIDMLFTDTAVIVPGLQGTVILASPQVKSQQLLSDTLNWMLVQDTFVAAGDERYLTIGNFNVTSNSDTVRSLGGFGTWMYFGSAYYYIDGVSVYEIDGTCNNYWDAGFDKYLAAGDSIRLGAINTDNSTFLWQNSIGGATFLSSNTDARPWASPPVTTIYYVTKNCGAGNIFTDTVIVYVTPHVGIDELTKKAPIIISPNPNAGVFTVQYDLKQDAIMEITDVSGKLMARYNLNAVNSKTDIRNEGLNGIYLYRIIAGGTQFKAGKLVILK